MRPDGGPSPFPLLLDCRIRSVNELADTSQHLSSPVPEFFNPLGDVRRGASHVRSCFSVHAGTNSTTFSQGKPRRARSVRSPGSWASRGAAIGGNAGGQGFRGSSRRLVRPGIASRTSLMQAVRSGGLAVEAHDIDHCVRRWNIACRTPGDGQHAVTGSAQPAVISLPDYELIVSQSHKCRRSGVALWHRRACLAARDQRFAPRAVYRSRAHQRCLWDWFPAPRCNLAVTHMAVGRKRVVTRRDSLNRSIPAFSPNATPPSSLCRYGGVPTKPEKSLNFRGLSERSGHP